MASFSPRISPSYVALRTLLIAAPLVSSLQVTPNSPCSKVCVDSTTLDLSDPNSSNTRNSDIVCKDADLESPAGTKWKDCMTCLQTNTFSQGSESDQTWFLYNLRYSLSYCVFGFPNATNVENTPCRTSMACGPLQENLEHGILDPTKATTYSYCSGAATHHEEYERCSQCVSAERKTLKLANYLTALEAGCQQQPKPGKFVALNDTIFLDGHVTIVDPATITPAVAPSSGLPTNTIVGIVVAGLAAIIIGSAVTFVCYRKRLNRRKRADAEAKYYASGGAGGHGSRHKHNSSLSFQCQTHMQSPRFWPGAEGAPGTALSPVNEMGGEAEREPKMIDPSSQSSIHAAATENPSSWESAYHQHPEAQAVQFSSRAPSHNSRSTTPNNNSTSSLPMPMPMPMPLHQITTSVPPAVPANVYTSPSSVSGGYNLNHSPSDSISGGAGNISAVSARSTTALLPTANSSNNGSFRPYIPAEHGIHGGGSPQSFSASTFSSPVSGTTASPLLKHHTWQQQQQQQQNNQAQQKQQQQQQQQAARVKNFSTPLGAALGLNSGSANGSGTTNGSSGNGNGNGSTSTSTSGGTSGGNIPPPPPGPPPPKAPRLSLPKKPSKKMPPMSGSPVESTEIKTTFSAPPRK